MRTTLTIEPAIGERIRRRMRETDLTLKSVINEALREGLRVLETGRRMPPKFVVEPHDFGLRPGIDPDRIEQFADDLDDAEITAKLKGA